MKKNWQTKNIENCIEKVVYTSKIQRKDFLDFGHFPIVSQERELINGYWNNKKDLLDVKKPVVVFGDHTKILKFIDFDFVLGADGVKILQPKDFLYPKYFYYFLQNINLRSLGYSRHYRLLKEEDIIYPESITEQKRIVKILDEMFEKIAKVKKNTENNLQNSKELFKSYLNNIFLNQSKLWKEEKISYICKVIAGQSPEGKFYNKLGKGLPFYQGKKDFGEKHIKEPTVWTTKVTKEAEKGDILMSVRAPVGPTNFATGRVCIGRGLAAIRVGDEIDKDFLFYFFKMFEEKLVGNSGAVFDSINKTQIESIEVPVPSVLDQKIIVKKLGQLSEQTNKLESIYKNKLLAIEELKKSILQKAFSGEL